MKTLEKTNDLSRYLVVPLISSLNKRTEKGRERERENKGMGCNTVFMVQKPVKYIKKRYHLRLFVPKY